MTDAESRIHSQEKAVMAKTISELEGKLNKQKAEMTQKTETVNTLMKNVTAAIAKLPADQQEAFADDVKKLNLQA